MRLTEIVPIYIVHSGDKQRKSLAWFINYIRQKMNGRISAFMLTCWLQYFTVSTRILVSYMINKTNGILWDYVLNCNWNDSSIWCMIRIFINTIERGYLR